MSLLLDAMRKNGDPERQGKPELQLEEHPGYPPQPSASASTPAAPANPAPVSPAQPPQAAPASRTAPGSRAAGENLFAAKKPAPVKKRRWKLGFIPTVLLIAAILFAAGGYYVWLEIQPPQQARYIPQPQPAAPPVAAAPAPQANTPPPLLPITPPDMAAAPVPAPVETSSPPAVEQAIPKPVRKKTAARKKPALRAPKATNPLGIQRSQEADPLDATLAAAYSAYQKGDNATAWQRYREALAKDAKNRDALLGLAVIAQQQGQDDAALHYYRQVMQLDPRDPVANAGLAAFGAGDPANTESRLKQLIAQQPDAAALHFALGNHYADQSRWSEAQQAYFSALSNEPANALFAFNLAISLDHLGQAKLAAQYYQKALQLDPAANAGFDHASTQQRLKQLTR